MTHPHYHHALAALWSLRASWPHLTDAAARARQALAEHGDAGTLRSQVYGVIGRSSGHGDPIGDAIERDAAGSGFDPYSPLADEVRRDMTQLAAYVLDAPGVGLAELIEAVPTLTPALAEMVGDTADAWDRRVRRRLRMGDDRKLVPELACPGCDMAGALALRVSAPKPWQVVVCTAGCVCQGPGCGCGMGVEVAGVAHIWTAAEMTAVLARGWEGAAA